MLQSPFGRIDVGDAREGTCALVEQMSRAGGCAFFLAQIPFRNGGDSACGGRSESVYANCSVEVGRDGTGHSSFGAISGAERNCSLEEAASSKNKVLEQAGGSTRALRI